MSEGIYSNRGTSAVAESVQVGTKDYQIHVRQFGLSGEPLSYLLETPVEVAKALAGDESLDASLGGPELSESSGRIDGHTKKADAKRDQRVEQRAIEKVAIGVKSRGDPREM
jgi:hypothetical protein